MSYASDFLNSSIAQKAGNFLPHSVAASQHSHLMKPYYFYAKLQIKLFMRPKTRGATERWFHLAAALSEQVGRIETLLPDQQNYFSPHFSHLENTLKNGRAYGGQRLVCYPGYIEK